MVIQRTRSGQVAQVVERSPEKAGVGGSTPSLATIIPKDLSEIRLPEAEKTPTVDHPRLLDDLSSRLFVQTHGLDHLGLGLHTLVHARVSINPEKD